MFTIKHFWRENTEEVGAENCTVWCAETYTIRNGAKTTVSFSCGQLHELELSEGDKVYIENSSGKTIDTIRVNTPQKVAMSRMVLND